MARWKVPAGATPRDTSTAVAWIDICDLWPEHGAPPCGRVTVRIVPVGTVTPDAAGNLLHPLFEWAHPAVTIGKRRSAVKNAAPTGGQPQAPIQIETDPGDYFVSTEGRILLMGGVPGDEYEVTAGLTVIRDDRRRRGAPGAEVDLLDPAFEYRLTTVFFNTSEDTAYFDLAASPLWHTDFYVAHGAAQLVTPAGAISLTNYGPAAKVPLNSGKFQINSGVFVFMGAL